MRIFVTIDGNRFEAAKAAAARGMGLAFRFEECPAGRPKTHGEIGGQHLKAVQAWHAENVGAVPIYRVGALCGYHTY